MLRADRECLPREWPAPGRFGPGMGCGASAARRKDRYTPGDVLEMQVHEWVVKPILASDKIKQVIQRAKPVTVPTIAGFAADEVLEALKDGQLQEIFRRITECPKVQDLDPYCVALYLNFLKLTSEHSKDPKMVECTIKLTEKATLSSTPYTMGGFRIPEAQEDEDFGGQGFVGAMMAEVTEDVIEFITGDVMQNYDAEKPVFCETLAEAAVVFHVLVRQYMPSEKALGPYHRPLHLDGDLTALCFGGFAQWYLQGIHDGGWSNREAGPQCVVPPGAQVVVDVCGLAAQEVRPGFERLGAACFFDANRKPLGIWIENPPKMVWAVGKDEQATDVAAEEWAFAAFAFRSSLFFGSYGVNHLVWCHWIVSNSLVTAAREHLGAEHPLRRLVKPFTFGSISINRSAMVRLTPKGGAGERASAWPVEALHQAIDQCSRSFRYQSFEDFLRAKELPGQVLDKLPLAQDGRRLWEGFQSFVAAFLAGHWPTQDLLGREPEVQSVCAGVATDPLERDPEIQSFWVGVDGARAGLSYGLPALSRAALTDYLTHAIFFSTAVHELMGNFVHYTTTPNVMSFRIHKREYFGATAKGRLPQASQRDFLTNVSICAATQLKMPQLTATVRRMAVAWGDPEEWGDHPPSVKAFKDFAENLESIAKAIDEDNKVREHPFVSFNPRNLEVSVSL